MLASRTFKQLLFAGAGAVAMAAGAQGQTCVPVLNGGVISLECSGDFGDPSALGIIGGSDILLDSTFRVGVLGITEVPGVLTNDGVIDSTGDAYGQSALVLTGAPGHVMEGFVNNGLINSNELGGVELDVGVTLGSFTNNGLIFSTDVFGGGVGLFGDLSGDFTNTGDIISYGVGVIVRGEMGGDFINTTGASIESGDGRYGLEVYNFGGLAGDFVNDGLIFGRAGGVLFSDLFGGGDIGGDFVNLSNGVLSGDGVFPGAGALIEGRVGGNVINLGFIGGGEDGLRIGGGVGGDFYNDGLIIGVGNDGVNITGLEENFFNDEAGWIQGGDEGVELNSFSGLFVWNEGQIFGNSDTGLQIDNIGLTALLIQNFGVISGGFEGVNAVSLSGAGVNLGNSGVISGSFTGASIDGGSAGIVVLNLLGAQILADPGTAGSIGLYLNGDSSFVLNNGLIAGETGLLATLGDDIVLNQGRILGHGGVAVDLDDGDDVFYLDTNGSYQGSVLGGAGMDEFRLNRRWRTNDFIGGFEFLLVDGDGELIVTRSDLSFMEVLNLGRINLGAETLTADSLFNFGLLTSEAGVLTGDVNNFGAMIGDGTVIGGDLNNAGVISPGRGGMVSTLTVNGNFRNQQAGGDLDGGPLGPVTLTDPGVLIFTVDGLNTDFISVGGFARIGGQVGLASDLTALLRARGETVLLTAAGGATGNPELLNQGGLLFSPYLRTSGNDLLFGHRVENFSTVMGAASFNDRSSAGAMQARWEAGASGLDNALLAVNAWLIDPQAAMDSASPEPSAAAARLGARHSTHAMRGVADCISGVVRQRCDAEGEHGETLIWARLGRDNADLNPDGNAVGVEDSLTGFTFGAERQKGGVSLGGFLAFADGDSVLDQDRGAVNGESLSGGVYARYATGGFVLSGLVGATQMDADVDRWTAGGLALGSTDGSYGFARVDAVYGWTDANLTFGLAASVDHVEAELDSYAETGSSGFDLDIAGAEFQNTDATLRLFADQLAGGEG